MSILAIITAVFTAVIGGILAAVQSSSSEISPIVYLLGALLAGGIGVTFTEVYKTRKLGKVQGDQMIANAMKEAVGAAQVMIVEYRRELADAQRVKSELTDILVKRNEQIQQLENELRTCNDGKEEIQKHYEECIGQLAQVRDEERAARERAENLELKLAAVEAMVHNDTPPDSPGK